FRLKGQWLAIVHNPLEAPTSWRLEQVKLPFSEIDEKHELTFGAALLQHGHYLYIYGVDDVPRGSWRPKNKVLPRVRLDSVRDFSTWRFYREGQWITEPKEAGRLAGEVANDYSVTYHPGLNSYILICTENGLSPNIVARTAPAPWGPWSAPALIY